VPGARDFPPALAVETEEQMRKRVSAKLHRWLDAGLVGDDVFRFTASDTSPQEARDWMEILSPAAFFDKDAALCAPPDLETCAEAIKYQRYPFLETYLQLHVIAGTELPPLLDVATMTKLCAMRLFGKIISYWETIGGWDPDAWLQRCKADAAKTLAEARAWPEATA
jgi:hypothetical protein